MATELIQSLMVNDNSTGLNHTAGIWSLGCTIIEMITVKPPRSEYEQAQAIFKVMRSSPPIPETSAEGRDFCTAAFEAGLLGGLQLLCSLSQPSRKFEVADD